MNPYKIVQWLVVLLCLTILVGINRVDADTQKPESIYFDDTDPNTIRLGNDYYEIGIRKTNGSISYIYDKASNQNASEGSRRECLWGSVFRDVPQPNDYVGGCHYRHDNESRKFHYEWNATYQRLNLSYIATPPEHEEVNVWVDITPSASNWFDMRLFLQNKSGNIVDRVLFPSDLVFLQSDIQEGLVPTMPGIVLKSAFFTTFLPAKQPSEYTVTYPSWPGIFADYLAIKSAKGNMAMYSIYKQDETVSTRLGFIYDNADPPYIANSVYTYHTFNPAIENNVTWDSPMVRIHIGQNYTTTLAAYRQNNHIDMFPSLQEKLGEVYTQTVKSPIIKIDVDQSISYYEGVFPQIPSPAILHWVSYWTPSFDENYPDFLPPRPEWGTTAEMSSLFSLATTYGFLNMPYTNPTWWDDESPTLEGQDISSIAFIDNDGNPKYECYTVSSDAPDCTPENASRESTFNQGCEYPYLWLHGGYAVSPYAPFVQQRLTQLMQEMTTQIPSDFIFEDQIGAGDRGYDYNVHSPSATSYLKGWLEHTATFSNSLLMTETGYDLLSKSEVGFNGSYLLLHRNGETTEWWGDGNWYPYPLAAMAARDKTLFYQHNLAPETFTFDKETLSWNLAMGYMLSYGLNTGGLDSPWIELVNLFQTEVLAEYADELVTNFRLLQDNVTETAFETFTVTANWNGSVAYDVGEHTIVPNGAYVVSDDGTISAGIFNAYNGLSLTSGEHFIIEKRQDDNITIWQPIGNDTDIKLSALHGWENEDVVLVGAYNDTRQSIANSFVTVDNNAITFTYQSNVNGADVTYYKITGPITLTKIYMPVVLKQNGN